MGVQDGQPVDAAVTNPAFINKNIDDTTPSRLGLANNGSDSGASITNAQGELNSILSFIGETINLAPTALPPWNASYVGATGDALFERAEALTHLFAGSTGHKHTGVDGDGPAISGSSIGSVPLMLKVIEMHDFYIVSGSAIDVSAYMANYNPSSSLSSTGIVVNSPYNLCLIRDEDDNKLSDQYLDTIYGRITAASTWAPPGTGAGNWTLSFYSEINAVETAYTFGVPTSGHWYARTLVNPLAAGIGYQPFFDIPEAKPSGSGSGGGGGGALEWLEASNAPTPAVEYNNRVYLFQSGLAQALYASIKVPASYIRGTQINLKILLYTPDTAGTNFIYSYSTWVGIGVNQQISSTSNQHTSTNTAFTVPGTTLVPTAVTLDLTDASGQIFGNTVNPGDFINVEILRGSDTGTSDIRFLAFATEVIF